MPNVFVEEYRKELRLTGYPFAVNMPLTTDTGYALASGSIEDASLYCESAAENPFLSFVEKTASGITFAVGKYAGSFSMQNIPDVLSLYSESGIFGGILVLNAQRIRSLESWKYGKHSFVKPPAFCPRCIELTPPVGVHGIFPDSGEIISAEPAISGGVGSPLSLLVSLSGTP